MDLTHLVLELKIVGGERLASRRSGPFAVARDREAISVEVGAPAFGVRDRLAGRGREAAEVEEVAATRAFDRAGARQVGHRVGDADAIGADHGNEVVVAQVGAQRLASGPDAEANREVEKRRGEPCPHGVVGLSELAPCLLQVACKTCCVSGRELGLLPGATRA
jgi:hypothetical protein